MSDSLTFNYFPSSPIRMDASIFHSAEQFNVKLSFTNLLVADFGSFASAWDTPDRAVRCEEIEQGDLPTGEQYEIIAPISAIVTRDSDIEFEASIPEANLAATGCTYKDAFSNLVCEMLDAFDYLQSHSTELGPGPTDQWNFLRVHIVKTHD